MASSSYHIRIETKVNQAKPITIRQGDALRMNTIIISCGGVGGHYCIMWQGRWPLLCPVVGLEATIISCSRARGHYCIS